MSSVRAPVRWAAALCVTAAACDGAPPAAARATLQLADLLGGADTMHARALEPRPFTFPADHGPHPEFRSEWWYFTGNLAAADGRHLGYQLTFFRSALTDTASYVAAAFDSPAGARSAWRTRHAWMAHFAVSDAGARALHAAEHFARDALGLARATAAPFEVRVGEWSAAGAAATFPLRLRAAHGGVAIDLLLEQGKPIVMHGERGLSRKGAQPGNASHYYSLTRMPTTGTVRIGAQTWTVTGSSWFDREWSTSSLAAGLAGWDWLALQLDDDTELMLYRLRREDGTADPFSAGTLVGVDGAVIALRAADFEMASTDRWRAPSGVDYPVSWRISVPSQQLELEVHAAFDAQELDLAVRYWEGMARARGVRAGRRIAGRGYLELTGY